IDPVRIRRRSLHVVDLPSTEVRAVDAPLLALSIGGQDERTFLGAHQDSNSTHSFAPSLPAMRPCAPVRPGAIRPRPANSRSGEPPNANLREVRISARMGRLCPPGARPFDFFECEDVPPPRGGERLPRG